MEEQFSIIPLLHIYFMKFLSVLKDFFIISYEMFGWFQLLNFYGNLWLTKSIQVAFINITDRHLVTLCFPQWVGLKSLRFSVKIT